MKCPGQDMQYWNNDAIYEVACPECGHEVEFYKDDPSRKCGSCGVRFVNPRLDFGCAAYCQYAEQCLDTLPETGAPQKDLIKDKTAVEVKRYLHTDFKKIRKISELARISERVCREEGGNLALVVCASYLSELPTEAFDPILEKVGAPVALRHEIMEMLVSKEEAGNSSGERLVLTDARALLVLKEKLASTQETDRTPEDLAERTRAGLHYSTSRAIADEILSASY